MQNYNANMSAINEKYSNHFSCSYTGIQNLGKGFASGLEKMAKYIPADIS
ncbi:MAG: hypothetical protein ABEI74_02395 [Candidatus Pacearchaeota archaeon]